MNYAGLVGVVILVLSGILGMRKGLVRKLAGVLSLILSTLLIWACLPYITQFLRTQTPLYDNVRGQCEGLIASQTGKLLAGDSGSAGSSGSAAGSSAVGREQIKSLLEQYGMDSSGVDYMSDEELQGLIDQYFPGYTLGSDTLGSDVASAALSSLTKVDQTKLIRSLPVPSFLQDMMINYNNSEGYKKLDVTDFGGYIAGFFANLVLEAVAFLATFLLVNIILRAVFAALDLFARLPVISAVNRLGGLAVGLLEGVVIIWILMIILSLFSATEVGAKIAVMVSESAFLQTLADWNIFYKVTAGTMTRIL